MNFAYQQNFDEEHGYKTCSHLLDFANNIGIDTDWVVGLSEDMEKEQLTAIAQELKEAIEEQLRIEYERKLEPSCPIGPYADGFCTICGGRQP